MRFDSIKSLALVGIVSVGFLVNGCLTDDKKAEKKDTTKVDTTHALAAEKTLNVGAQGNLTLGSSLELDTGKVYLSGVANANLDGVDLVFMYYGSAYHIDNTESAKAAANAATPKINLADNWVAAKLNGNEFVKVTTKPANQEAAMTTFMTSSAKLSTSTVAQGDMFIVETTDGNFTLITVSAVTGTDNKGAADFKISIGTI
jgi:hypothetical protein